MASPPRFRSPSRFQNETDDLFPESGGAALLRRRISVDAAARQHRPTIALTAR